MNIERAQPGWPAVVVASAYQTGMLLMRNLERRGVRACCVDWDRKNAGFRSVYGRTHECPDPDARPAEWVGFMMGLARSFDQKPVLIAASDQFVSAMAAHAEELGKWFVYYTDSIQLQAALCTKKSLYHIAGEHGFPIPLTRFVATAEELDDFAKAAQYPCIMKPQQARMWESLPAGHPCFGIKLVRATSCEDLLAKYSGVSAFTPDVVVQEEIAGPDTAKLCYLSCYSGSGDRLGYAIVRELRTANPIHFGSASMVEPMEDPETESLCDRFLRQLGYRGLCEIELKRDSRDGTIKMIEANPRYTGTSDAAPYDGVDIGWLHYLDLIGRPVNPIRPQVRKFRHVMLVADAGSMRHYVERGLETWNTIAKSYRPPVYFYDVDPRDWRNFARTMLVLGRTVAGTAYRAVVKK
jgi:predicted ATP-grasp superfamily ATP-dependent carboligase